jgi:hypothetical protein
MKHLITITLYTLVIGLGIAYAGWMFAVPVMIFAAVIIPAFIPAKNRKGI